MEFEAGPGAKAPLSNALLWTGLSLLAFLAVEAALFRLPWYYRYVQPISSTGSVEYRLFWLLHAKPEPSGEVLVVGDSRIAEGFSAPKADASVESSGLHFWNIGLPQSTPRVWYYFLRDADPRRDRFREIVIALDHYSDQDSYDSAPKRDIDTNLVIGRLRISDAWDFAASMGTPAMRRAVFPEAVFKGAVLRRDLQEFLTNVPLRLAEARDAREHGLEYLNAYSGNPRDLKGLDVDWKTRKIFYPLGTPEEMQNGIHYTVMPDLPPQTGELTQYRMKWFGRIIDLYRRSKTRILFIEYPRAPLPPQATAAPWTFTVWAARQPRVTVADPQTFRDLESPEDFADGLHLNTRGRDLFTPRLAALVQADISRR